MAEKNAGPAQPAIARSWRGATRQNDGERYLDYLKATGLKEYRKTPGNLGVLALRRDQGDRAEFLLISFWKDKEAIRRFAGEKIEQAVFYPEDDEFLVQRDDHVDHYDVIFQDGISLR